MKFQKMANNFQFENYYKFKNKQKYFSSVFCCCLVLKLILRIEKLIRSHIHIIQNFEYIVKNEKKKNIKQNFASTFKFSKWKTK